MKEPELLQGNDVELAPDGIDVEKMSCPIGGDIVTSDDDRMIPVQIRTLNAPVSLVFNLREDCEPTSSCTAPSG